VGLAGACVSGDGGWDRLVYRIKKKNPTVVWGCSGGDDGVVSHCTCVDVMPL
jgi:hypothetical protein